jgi:hypothetical protein
LTSPQPLSQGRGAVIAYYSTTYPLLSPGEGGRGKRRKIKITIISIDKESNYESRFFKRKRTCAGCNSG